MSDIPTTPITPESPRHARFTIDLLPIVDKTDKYGVLNQLTVVRGLSDESFTRLFSCNKGDKSFSVERGGFVDEQLKKLGITLNSWDKYDFKAVRNSGISRFLVKGARIIGKMIILDSNLKNMTFYGEVDDFLCNGLNALSHGAGSVHEIEQGEVIKTDHLLKNGTLTIFTENKKHAISADTYCLTDSNANRACIVKDNFLRYLSYDKDNINPDGTQYDLSEYGNIKQIDTDPNNNFYFVISEQDGVHKLRILNRKTLAEVLDPFEGIIEIVHMSHATGKLLCIDIEGYLRVVQINTNALERGYVDNNALTIDSAAPEVIRIQDTSRHALAEALKSGGISVDPSMLVGNTTTGIDGGRDDADLIAQIWEIPVGESTLRALFDLAQSLDQIEQVFRAFLLIARKPEIAQVSGITEPIERIIREKRSTIQLAAIAEEIGSLIATLEQITDFGALIAVQKTLEDIRQRRSQITMVDADTDTKLRTLLARVQAKIQDYQTDHQSTIIQSIDTGLTGLSNLLDQIDYLTGITSIYASPIWTNLETQISYLSQAETSTYLDKMHALVKGRLTTLQRALDTQKNQDTIKRQKKIQEINDLLGQVREIAQTITTEEAIEGMQSTDPLVSRIRHECSILDKADEERLMLSLENVFQERIREIRLKQRDSRGAVRTLDEYGIDTGLYFTETGTRDIGYMVVGKRTATGMMRLELRLSNGQDNTFDFELYANAPEQFGGILSGLENEIQPVMIQSDFVHLQTQIHGWKNGGKNEIDTWYDQLKIAHEEKKDEKIKLCIVRIQALKKRYAKARFVEIIVKRIIASKGVHARPFLEKVNMGFIVLDEDRAVIKKLSDGCILQKQNQKGVDIIEGPPGLGKTEMVRFVAAVTNREIIRVQCSKMDASDMFFAPQLKAGETSRQPADWISLMQKPGVLILFDEIDKLSLECFDRLHSLFDGGRSVYDPQLGRLIAHTDAVFVGTRNSYEQLSNPIASRGTIIYMTPPSEINEAFKVSKYTHIPYFEKMDFAEFQRQYAKYTSGKTKTSDASEQQIATTFSNIHGLVKTLAELREKQKSQDFNRFAYEVSYRDAEQIFMRYQRSDSSKVSFSDIVLDILVPKVRAVVKNTEDKDEQETIVRVVVKENFK